MIFDPDAGRLDPDAGSERAITELSIATWNIEHFPKSAGTIEAVAGVVSRDRFDVLGIQEITDPAPFAALDEALPDYESFVSFDSWGDTRVGVLYRRDRVEVDAVERLFSRDSYAFPRDPLALELRVLDERGAVVFDFTLVVLHLKAMVDEESRQRRVAAIVALEEWMRARAAIDPDLVVIGDFNDELGDGPDQNVFGPFLDAPERYAFLTHDTERAGAYSYIPFQAMIDHVLVTTDALGEYGEGRTEVLALDEEMFGYRDLVSDHRPVVSRFVIASVE